MDGTDCVMLSGESAMGKYPVDAVAMLARIATQAEMRRRMISVREIYQGIDIKSRIKPYHLIAIGVEACLEYASPATVFVPTRSGSSARSLSLFRLPVWIIGVSSTEATCQGLVFSSGVHPVYLKDHPDEYSPFVQNWLQEHEIKGDIAVITEGPSTKHPGTNHRMEIIEVPGNSGQMLDQTAGNALPVEILLYQEGHLGVGPCIRYFCIAPHADYDLLVAFSGGHCQGNHLHL